MCYLVICINMFWTLKMFNYLLFFKLNSSPN